MQGRTGGNLELSNEQADAWTAGFILRPRWVDGLQIAIDYVNIDLEDAIESFRLTDIMRSCYDAVDFPNEFCSSFRRQPNGQLPATDAFVSGFVNAGERTFKAWTGEFLYSFDALNGQFDIFGSLIHIREDVETLLGTSTDTAGEVGQSEWQANLSLRYSREKWSALLQPRFIGEAVWDTDASPTRYSVPGFDNTWIVNGNFRYYVTEDIAVQLNINNLFDELPTPAAIATAKDGVFDNIGRYYRIGFTMSL